ncbi:ABC transporter substrate-binding protein/permease [Succinimonas amylolytica]|uniref:ABC transporter substrate-binding protein/permease n=1 Tax=Succinimonas amylolytica TaxID=83769 RepID=UPI0023A8C397
MKFLKPGSRQHFHSVAGLLLTVLAVLTLPGCSSETETREITTVEDLCQARIGVQIGTTTELAINDYLKKHECPLAERFNSTPDAVAALNQGKLDAVLTDELPARRFVEDNPNLRLLDTPFQTESYAAILPKNQEDLLTKFNAIIDDMSREGVYDQLYDTFVNGTGNFHYTPSTWEGQPELVIATSPDFPPYEFYKDGQITGIEMEMAAIIADRLHRPLKIESMEFDSIINAVSSGKVHAGFSGFSKTEERAKVINFTHDICTTRIMVIIPAAAAAAARDLTFTDRLYNNFIKEDRWQLLAKGLGVTILISVFAALIGLMGGTVMATIRVMNHRTGRFAIPSLIIRLFVNIIRGTPVMVQLLIIYYVIFAAVDIDKILVAIVAFGINSMAYTTEIIRSGIQAIPEGQFEAGHALGLRPFTIMKHIVLPQAFKNVLPALANEGISLIKETSICGYIGLMDLTRGGVVIRNTTFEAFLPLLAVALIYLAIIGTLSAGVSRMERSLKKNER